MLLLNVGLLITLIKLNPAIVPAFFVAVRCESLKYVGHVMTAYLTGCPKYVSAYSLSLSAWQKWLWHGTS